MNFIRVFMIGKNKYKNNSLPKIFKRLFETTFEEKILKRILEIVQSSAQNDKSIKTTEDVKNTLIAGVENPHNQQYRKLEKIVLSHIGFKEFMRLKTIGPKMKK